MSDRIARKVKRFIVCLLRWPWHVRSRGASCYMEQVHGWEDNIKSGRWGVHWFDVALLKRKERELAELRSRTKLQSKDLQELDYVLEVFDNNSRLSPDFLPELCWEVISGEKDVKKLGQQLYKLVSLSFFLAFWVTVPQYEIGSLRQVVAYERDLLLQRQEA